MAKLGDILHRNLRSSGISQTVEAAQVITELQKLLKEEFPAEVAKRMNAVSLRHHALTVHVESSAVGQELKMHERNLLEKLQKKFPSIRLDRIRFDL